MTERHKALSSLAVVLIVVGVVPLALDRDSFPLSTYPMFSSRRTTAEPVDTAVGITADGSVARLSPTMIAGTDEIIIATVTVGKALADGTAAELCSDIAGRISGSNLTSGEGRIVAVEVVTERFDAVQWYDGDRTPLQRTVHARCETGTT